MFDIRNCTIRSPNIKQLYFSVDGQHTLHSQESGSRIIIASLRSHVIKMRVTKKPDQQNADLLGEDDGNNGIWNSITR